MENSIVLNNFNDYLDNIEEIIKECESEDRFIILYRGQGFNWELLPSVARLNPSIDSTEVEINMLNELKRRRPGFNYSHNFEDDWDWLVYTQHYGLNTRLLDWTSNPLAALWFALSDNIDNEKSAYVYIFRNAQQFILEKSKDPSPFKILKTRILKPSMNNERIVAQSGWFTAHKFSTTSGRYVPIENHIELMDKIVRIDIPAELKKGLINKLDLMGVNFQSLFPDISGVCHQINWEFQKKPNFR